MSDEQSSSSNATGASTEATGSTEQNLKAEFNRKIDNVETLLRQQSEIIKSLSQKQTPPPQFQQQESSDADLDDLVLTNPREFAKRVTQNAKAEITQDLQKSKSYEDRRQQILNAIVTDYPEALDQSSSLYKKADEYYRSMSADEQRSPIAMKAAFRDAAIDLDIKPKSKRGDTNVDSFSFGNSGGSSSRRTPKDEVAPETTELLALMGMDTSDPVIQAMAKEKSKRQNWGRSQPINTKGKGK